MPQVLKSCENCSAKKMSIFSDIDANENNSIAQKKLSYKFKKGQVIYTQNDRPLGIYCIRSGNIKLSKTDSRGNETIVRIAGAGEILGDESLFQENRNEKTATAINDVEACYITLHDGLGLIKKSQHIHFNLMKKIHIISNKMEEALCSFHQKKVSERLAELLLKLGQSNEDNTNVAIKLHLNREEMAKYIGTANETLIRSMTELKNAGLIEDNHKKIIIKDKKALSKWAKI